MYLKRLELQGFKSFPEKIRLEFNKGITVVVGPNGSGKSNIADAVRWVLGEKSAKSLRGAKMEDIIFNGTANRKPMGFAEVSMVMDNTDRKLNLDFSEVTVTRRVYRSGESDYLINGSACRLKDILELFMDTGVGKEGYSIIGQGRIDEILSTKSEDRRMLFEEAAGIVKYKTRRTEAANNLEKEHANLVRVNDIISELETQVGPLEKQAEKTKKYLVLADRLKLVQVNMFVRQADSFAKEIDALAAQIAQLNGSIAEEEDKKQLILQENGKNKERLANVEESIEKTTADMAEKRSLKEQRQNDTNLYDTETKHIKSDIERIKAQMSDADRQRGEKQNKIALIQTEIKGKRLGLENKTNIYGEKQAEFDKFDLRVSESEEKVSAYNTGIIEKMKASNDLKSEKSKIQAVIQQQENRIETLDAELDGLDASYEEKKVSLKVLEKRYARIEEEGRLISEHIESFSDEKKKLSEDIAEKNTAAQRLVGEISEKNSRFKVISDLEREHEGYYGGVKAILQQRDSKNPDFKGICGAVGEVIKLDKRYETAIEIALGGAVQNIITRNDDTVKTAIRFLKETKKGRATFLPMTAVKGRPLGGEKHSLLKEKGVIGIAKELISYSPEYENIMSNLLDRVIVVDDIDNATALAKKTNHTYKIVTLDGELFNPGGSVTGGSMNKKAAGIFSRGREMAELKDKLKELLEQQYSVNADLDKAKQKLGVINDKLEEAREELQELVINRTQENSNLEFARSELARIDKQKHSLEKEFDDITKQIEENRAKDKEFDQKIKTLEDEINALYDKMEEHQSLIKGEREHRESLNEEIMELRLEISGIENTIGKLEDDIERTNAEIADIDAANRDGKAQIEEFEKELENKKQQLERAFDDIERLKNEYDALEEQHRALNDERAGLNKLIEASAQKATDCIETVSTLNNHLNKLELRHEQTKQKSQQLYDSMWENYEMTLVQAKNFEQLEASDDALQKEERGLKAQIKALGPINPNAVEEYEEVKTRYDLYTSQHDDIIESEKKLTEIIAQLETLMEKQFREQFKIISENFTRVFRVMFGGGTASLKLADDNDILNCGINIEAQPPGKALQNMMLLSGGEKALTAMSLLFAILEMKPSPFCILDEIEAALDDANVDRYANYLKHFTDTTQFVVISHRKGTMEAADILYGVTMQEQGISKLVSVNFTDEKGII